MAAALRRPIHAGWDRSLKAATPFPQEASPAVYQLGHPLSSQHSPSCHSRRLPPPQPFFSSQGLGGHRDGRVLRFRPFRNAHHKFVASHGLGNIDKEPSTARGGRPPQSILNLPTCLTLARVLAVPLLAAAFYSPHPWATPFVRSSIFVAAALTDWLDGYLARKMNTVSEFGAFLDPVADKLMVAAALVLLCSRRDSTIPGPAWILTLPAIAIIGREITMSALREWAASQAEDVHKAVAVNVYGKWKTASQMLALTILLGLKRDLPRYVAVLGVSLLYMAAALALLSLAIYFQGMWFAFTRHQ